MGTQEQGIQLQGKQELQAAASAQVPGTRNTTAGLAPLPSTAPRDVRTAARLVAQPLGVPAARRGRAMAEPDPPGGDRPNAGAAASTSQPAAGSPTVVLVIGPRRNLPSRQIEHDSTRAGRGTLEHGSSDLTSC